MLNERLLIFCDRFLHSKLPLSKGVDLMKHSVSSSASSKLLTYFWLRRVNRKKHSSKI